MIARASAMHSDTAATGLALLSFLGAGYTHQPGGKYHQEVDAGLRFLLSNKGLSRQADFSAYFYC